MTNADKVMHPQHFGTDPTDIRIWINPKIRIRITDNFCFKFLRRREGLRSLRSLGAFLNSLTRRNCPSANHRVRPLYRWHESLALGLSSSLVRSRSSTTTILSAASVPVCSLSPLRCYQTLTDLIFFVEHRHCRWSVNGSFDVLDLEAGSVHLRPVAVRRPLRCRRRQRRRRRSGRWAECDAAGGARWSRR